MSLDAFTNLAKVLVSGSYSDTDVNITLVSGYVSKLPVPSFNATWWNISDYADPTDDPFVEIIRVTGVNGNVLTATRAQEGTTATAKFTGKTYAIHAGLTAKTLNTDIPALIPTVPAFNPTVDDTQRIFYSTLPNIGTTLVLVSRTAYFVYLGRMLTAVTPKFVEFFMPTGGPGTGTQVAEIGLFSSVDPPNKGTKTMTPVVTSNNVSSLLVASVVRSNAVAFATLVPAGTYLWAGLRVQMSLTQPSLPALILDMNQGRVLSFAAAAAFDGVTTYSAPVIAQPSSYANTAMCPDLRATLD